MKRYLFLLTKLPIRLCQFILPALILICISFAGYGQESGNFQTQIPIPQETPTPKKEYAVGPGDTLFIIVWGEKDLSGVVTVGPDGMISLPQPVGVIDVSGLTAAQIQTLLITRLSEYINNPKVTVSIRTFEGFDVHIFGQVKIPMYYRAVDNTTLQELIAMAGGTTKFADLKHIRLFRIGEDGNVEEKQIDFSLFLKQNDLSANPPLKEKDVVFIPRISQVERAKGQVTVLGSVTEPGSFELEEALPLLDVLTLTGGLTPLADLRKVWLLEPSRKPKASVNEVNINSYEPRKISLNDFLTGKDPNANPIVSPGSAIFVESTQLPEEPTFPVNVTGQVGSPGTYRVNEKTRLVDALFMAGGFSQWAKMDKVTIIHTAPKSPKSSVVDVTKYFTSGDMESNPPVFESDTIVVPLDEKAKQIPPIHTIFSPSMTINVIGEVRSPGTYQLSQTTNILDAVTIAGGPTSDANLELAAVIQSVEGGQNQIEINLEKVLTEGQFSLMPPLKSGDTIFIPKQKEELGIWRQIVKMAADVSTIGLAILILTGRR